jgi:hypothetical protein
MKFNYSKLRSDLFLMKKYFHYNIYYIKVNLMFYVFCLLVQPVDTM